MENCEHNEVNSKNIFVEHCPGNETMNGVDSVVDGIDADHKPREKHSTSDWL